MSSWLELRRLRYFIAITQYGSLSEAARQLRVAQPALTHHLREIEADLGEAVFVRRRHGVRLTEVGARLLEEANKVVAAANEAQDAMSQFLSDHRAESKIIQVAVLPTLSSTLTTKMLSAATRKLPGHRLHISELYTRESRELIDMGTLDFSVSLTSPSRPSGQILANEELYYVQSTNIGAVSSEPISMLQLSEQPLILPSSRSSILREYLDEICLAKGVKLNVSLEIDGVVPRKEAVTAGLGGTILPMAAIVQEVAAGILAFVKVSPSLIRPIVLEQRHGIDEGLSIQIREIIADIMHETGYFDILPELPSE